MILCMLTWLCLYFPVPLPPALQLDDLLAAVAEGTSSELLAEVHCTLLRFIQAEMGACAIAACVLFPCCRFRRYSDCCRYCLQGVTVVCTTSAGCRCSCVPLYFLAGLAASTAAAVLHH